MLPDLRGKKRFLRKFQFTKESRILIVTSPLPGNLFEIKTDVRVAPGPGSFREGQL